MSELITITGDSEEALRVSTIDFAEGLGIQHKNLLETISTHKQAIEVDFGLIAFETRKVEGKGRPERFAELTEEQALFIGTLSRNSTRVVSFKAVLVRSFSEARKRLLALATQATLPQPTTTEQLLVQLVAGQQELLQQLRADVEQIKLTGQRPPKNRRLPAPATPPHRANGPSTLRQLVTQKINDYCAFHAAQQTEAYNYLYKRMYEVYAVNVYRLIRGGRESIVDAIERYGHLDRLYSLIQAELVFTEE